MNNTYGYSGTVKNHAMDVPQKTEYKSDVNANQLSRQLQNDYNPPTENTYITESDVGKQIYDYANGTKTEGKIVGYKEIAYYGINVTLQFGEKQIVTRLPFEYKVYEKTGYSLDPNKLNLNGGKKRRQTKKSRRSKKKSRKTKRT
jgi:hypothetical protein